MKAELDTERREGGPQLTPKLYFKIPSWSVGLCPVMQIIA